MRVDFIRFLQAIASRCVTARIGNGIVGDELVKYD